ncbi:helix-turn-helix domain-containing protein [Alkalihalophilus marmarensis]
MKMELTPSEKLRLFRMRRGINQTELGSILEVSQMQISRLERGEIIPDNTEQVRIEKILKENIWKVDD